MQVYILRERARTEELVDRAVVHGYGALVLTVDAPVSGLRLREWRMGVHLPDDLALPNLAGDSTDSAREGGFMAIVTHEFEPALTPDDIGWLAGLSVAPRRGEGRAAGGRRRAVHRGGGRGRRGVEPRGAPAGRRPGHGRHPGRGRRRGRPAGPRCTSTAGCAARPTSSRPWRWGRGPPWSGGPSLWALATGGADGVAALLRWYEAELRRAMALCGAATVDAIDRALVRRAPGWALEVGPP